MEYPLSLKAIIEQLKHTLANQSQILFAYLHGSVLSSEKPRDIDVAVYLISEEFDTLQTKAELSLGFAIPLEMRLEKILQKRVDIQVINRAPLSFRYRVINEGRLIIDNDSNKRCDFEYLSRVEYFDFSPRQKEYLREVIT
jgi:predicted nucleotidyltransferase